MSVTVLVFLFFCTFGKIHNTFLEVTKEQNLPKSYALFLMLTHISLSLFELLAYIV